MSVALALYKPHRRWDVGSRLICWWTNSPYSHCELVVGSVCFSSSLRDGGVRAKIIDLDPAHWDIIATPWVPKEAVYQHYERTQHLTYGWSDLITQQVLRIPFELRNAYFCSEWCAEAMGLPEPEMWHPGVLGDYARTRRPWY